METSSVPPAPLKPSSSEYPIAFSVDYPERKLNRLTTFLRAFTVIPIAIVAALLPGGSLAALGAIFSTGSVVVMPLVLIILFRRKYPRWWFDWNLEVNRFLSRIGVYAALMDDRYPSTDEQQSVHLHYPDPETQGLERGLPLVKWLLAIPHYFVLFFLYIGAIFAVIFAWFAILITGRYPRGIFTYLEGVARWGHRVYGYAVTLVTDQYPPFRLKP